jgi:hypothetical protein
MPVIVPIGAAWAVLWLLIVDFPSRFICIDGTDGIIILHSKNIGSTPQMSRLAIFLISILSVSCATLSSHREMTFSQPFETVWEESIRILGTELKLPIIDVDKPSGQITTGLIVYTRPPRTFDEQLAKGYLFGVPVVSQNPKAVNVRYSLRISIKPEGAGTQVTVHEDVIEKMVFNTWEPAVEPLPIMDEIRSKLTARFEGQGLK